MSLPMMTFSLSPISESLRAWIAASVSTRVVSWNEAAHSHDSVARDALVIPMSTGRPAAGCAPSRLARDVSPPRPSPARGVPFGNPDGPRGARRGLAAFGDAPPVLRLEQ